MANRYDRSRRRVRRFAEMELDRVDRRIERRMDALDEAYNEGDYAEIAKQADAIADAATQGAEWSER